MAYNMSVVPNSDVFLEYLELIKNQYQQHSSIQSSFPKLPDPYISSLVRKEKLFDKIPESCEEVYFYALLGKSIVLACFNRLDEAIKYISEAILKVKDKPLLLTEMNAFVLDFQIKRNEVSHLSSLKSRVSENLEKQLMLLETDARVEKDLILTYHSLAKCYRQEQNYVNALLYALKALEVSKKVLGNKDMPLEAMDLCPFLREIAEIYEEAGSLQQALNYSSQMLSIYQAKNKRKSSIFTLKLEKDLLNKMKRLYAALSAENEASAKLKRTLLNLNITPNTSEGEKNRSLDLDVANEFMGLATLEARKGRILNARKEAVNAYAIFNQLTPVFRGLGTFFQMFAGLYEVGTDISCPGRDVSNKEAALYCYKHALLFYQKYKPNHPDIVKIEEKIKQSSAFEERSQVVKA